jgi:hypothetical protein
MTAKNFHYRCVLNSTALRVGVRGKIAIRSAGCEFTHPPSREGEHILMSFARTSVVRIFCFYIDIPDSYHFNDFGAEAP